MEGKSKASRPLMRTFEIVDAWSEAQQQPCEDWSRVEDPGRLAWQLCQLTSQLHRNGLTHGLLYTDEVCLGYVPFAVWGLGLRHTLCTSSEMHSRVNLTELLPQLLICVRLTCRLHAHCLGIFGLRCMIAPDNTKCRASWQEFKS